MLKNKNLNVCFLFFYLFLLMSLSAYAQESGRGATPPLTRGASNAIITLEVFNDYQCPGCASFNEILKKVEAERADKIQIIYRNYPITSIHKFARLAAQAVEAANKQDKFYEMMQQILTEQKNWVMDKNPEKLFITYARNLGLDVEQFKHDLKSKEVAERISLDVERVKSLKVDGTPTVFLNGKELNVSQHSYEALLEAIDEILKSSGQ